MAGCALHLVAQGSVAELPGEGAVLADVVEASGFKGCKAERRELSGHLNGSAG